MKFNWGTNIAIVYIAFVLLSVGMAVYMMNMDVNLVTEDYYEKELRYQDKINSINRADALPENLRLVRKEKSAELIFPKLFPFEDIEGEVKLYRPSSGKMDVTEKIELDSTYTLTIDIKILMPGYWKVKVDWRVKSVSYFNEFKLFL